MTSEQHAPQLSAAITKGLRVVTCGHSFHAPFIPSLLRESAESAGITGHVVAAQSFIGGSQAIQHFHLPDAENHAKRALRAGTVDVLTLSCFNQPDAGVELFAKLALQGNAQCRITVQELWLPEDRWPFNDGVRIHTGPKDFNATVPGALRQSHAPYFRVMDQHIESLNAQIGQVAVFAVPEGQATLLLRDRICSGEAPGVSTQAELFTDGWGHPSSMLQLLCGYCHFSVIYRSNPMGLPIPRSYAAAGFQNQELNRLLQELAWDAAVQHPLSGVAG